MLNQWLSQYKLKRRAHALWHDIERFRSSSEEELTGRQHISRYNKERMDPIVELWSFNFTNKKAMQSYFRLDPYDWIPIRWANLPNTVFWKAAASYIESSTCSMWPDVLRTALEVGNTIAMDHVPEHRCAAFLKSSLSTSFVHPDSWAWLIDHQFCQLSDVFKHEKNAVIPSYSPTFGDSGFYQSYDPLWVAEMCIKMFDRYDLSKAEKIRFMMLPLEGFSKPLWKEALPLCMSSLKDIDIALLILINFHDWDPYLLEHSSVLMHDVAALIRLNNSEAWEGYIPKHEGLRILHSLAPINNKIDLYFMAEKAHGWDVPSQQTAPTLELPELS